MEAARALVKSQNYAVDKTQNEICTCFCFSLSVAANGASNPQ